MPGPSCATRFIDSKGHSRFVLQISIILLFERYRRGGPLRPSRARAHHKQREVLPSPLNAPAATVGAFPTVGFLPVFHRPLLTKRPSVRPSRPSYDHLGAWPCATRFIDSKGHSRFVLRILIILSHPEPQTRAGRIAVHVHVVGTVIAHIAKTAMYAPPGIGSSRPSASSLEAADERGRVVKALPYDKQRDALQPSTTQLAA